MLPGTRDLLGWTWQEALQSLPHWRCLSTTLASHGDMPRWEAALNQLPDAIPSETSFGPIVSIGAEQDLKPEQRSGLESALKALHPWRKGPFRYFGLALDSEWRSDLKWHRLVAEIASLKDRRILDVGCGNGYYGWRMCQEGARQVIGIDPTRVFLMQYFSAQIYLNDRSNLLLPLALEDLPPGQQEFDTVFSLGVLSHRREPSAHLTNLYHRIRPGGELVLETLVLDQPGNTCLKLEGRYARMRNVWLLPTPDRVLQWLDQAGFAAARCIDVTPTTIEEQRTTDWMWFDSLCDGLNPDNPTLTVEGHAAPTRAIFLATPE